MKTTRTLEPAGSQRAGHLLLRVSGDTHPGLQRAHNEDRFHYDPNRGIFFVIDGVGGHAAGEKAAEIAESVLRERLERETGTVEDRIREAIALANNNIHRLASWTPEWRGMGCVLTVAVLTNGSVVVGHVGDTRLYKLRGSRLEKITRDHSPVGEREDAHEISEAEAMRHPRRNEVYRDVGSEPHEPGDPDFVDIFRIPFEPDAALLLCSDGLSDTVSSTTIAEVVRAYAGHPYEVVRALIDAANEAGGKDNITVVYAEGPDFSAAELDGATALADVHGTGRAASPPTRTTTPRGRTWRLIALIVLLLAVAGAAAILLAERWFAGTLPVFLTTAQPEIVVRSTDSIAAAIVRAAPGSTVLVEPGEYREQLRLKSGVRVRSRVPRGASIRLRGDGSEADPAVLAIDVSAAELSGFRIIGDAATPLGTGLYTRSADVMLVDVEVSGAAVAAIELAGGTAGSIVGVQLTDNAGTALVVRTGASPRIAHSEFARSGGAGRPAIVIEPGARPNLIGNVFHGITPDVFIGLTPAEREAVRQSNWFIGSATGRGRDAAATPSPDRRTSSQAPR